MNEETKNLRKRLNFHKKLKQKALDEDKKIQKVVDDILREKFIKKEVVI